MQFASHVNDNFTQDTWRQIDAKDLARPHDLPQVSFDHDDQGVMSLNLELSSQSTREIVHKLHNLKKGTQSLSLGEAFAATQTYESGTPLKSNEQLYRMSLVWQVNQELKRLSSSFHKPWTTRQMTEFCHLMLGVLIGVYCIQDVDYGQLDGIFTIGDDVWTEVGTDGDIKVRKVFLRGMRVNPHGLHFTGHHTECRLRENGMDEQTLSYILTICGQLELTTNRLVEDFELGSVLIREDDE